MPAPKMHCIAQDIGDDAVFASLQATTDATASLVLQLSSIQTKMQACYNIAGALGAADVSRPCSAASDARMAMPAPLHTFISP